MRIVLSLVIVTVFLFSACRSGGNETEKSVISVSIAPFGYFAEAIAGDDFLYNVMVPAGSDPHIYEPSMSQVQNLSKSVAYISNGHLDFEIAWLYRFYEVNPSMKIISFANNQDLLYAKAWQHGDHWHYEGVDPHFWISPRSALLIISDIRDLMVELNPEARDRYEASYNKLVALIGEVDREIENMLSPYAGRSFMIYHPVLAYFGRDYNLSQVAIEHEGKEPSPSAMKNMIDTAKELDIKTIFIQQEFDRKNAEVIAAEVGATVSVIDPLSGDWLSAVKSIAKALAVSFEG